MLRARTLAWLDRWIRGNESIQVVERIEARPLDCTTGTAAPTRQARDWSAFATVHRRFTEPARQLAASSVVDPAGERVDPVSAARTACQELPVEDPAGVVSYRFSIDEGTILGSPAITADIRVLGARSEDTQLAARLWEVNPPRRARRASSASSHARCTAHAAVRSHPSARRSSCKEPAGGYRPAANSSWSCWAATRRSGAHRMRPLSSRSQT